MLKEPGDGKVAQDTHYDMFPPVGTYLISAWRCTAIISAYR